MFSIEQKREISDKIQKILRETNHPELPLQGEIAFQLHVDGAAEWSWADISNNGTVRTPESSEWNEKEANSVVAELPILRARVTELDLVLGTVWFKALNVFPTIKRWSDFWEKVEELRKCGCVDEKGQPWQYCENCNGSGKKA